MANLTEVLADNKWNSAVFQGSHAVNSLLATGIFVPIQGMIRQDIDGLTSDNMKSIIVSGIIFGSFSEPLGMDTTDNEIEGNEDEQVETAVKTFYQATAERKANLQQILMPMSVQEATDYIINKFGSYWARHYNKLACHTIVSISKIGNGEAGGVTIGDGTENFNRSFVRKSRKLRGDKGYGKIGQFYMSDVTIDDILAKQDDGTITEKLITEKYGQVIIKVDGIDTVVTSDVPQYVYNGVTPIHVDEDMQDGLIGIVDVGAFGIGEKDIEDAITEDSNNKAGKGAGVTTVISRKIFILHPAGFKFIGEKGTTFAKNSELTYTELETTKQYEVARDVKDTKITILKVKIG